MQREQAEHLGLVGHQDREQLREPDRLVAEVAANELVSGRRGVALVEDEVEDGEHRAQALGQQVVGRDAERDAARRGSSASRERGAARASPPGRGTRARSRACRSPPTSRSVSATRASGASAGWQQVKTRLSRSSGIELTSSSSSVRSSSSRARSSVLRASVRSRRMRSIARFRAVVTIHADGLRGVPSRGQLLDRGREGVLHRVLGELEVTEDADQDRDRAAPFLPEAGSRRSFLLDERPDLDRAGLRDGDPRRDVDRLVEVFALGDEVAADDCSFVSGERPVGHDRRTVRACARSSSRCRARARRAGCPARPPTA